MRLVNLKNAQPDIGRKIIVLYENNKPVQNLEIVVDRYDGSLTHNKDMPGVIFWTYYENFFEDVDSMRKE